MDRGQVSSLPLAGLAALPLLLPPFHIQHRTVEDGDGHLEVRAPLLQGLTGPGKGRQDVAQRKLARAARDEDVVKVALEPGHLSVAQREALLEPSARVALDQAGAQGAETPDDAPRGQVRVPAPDEEARQRAAQAPCGRHPRRLPLARSPADARRGDQQQVLHALGVLAGLSRLRWR